MSQPTESQVTAVSAPRPSFAPGTLVFIAVWACVFTAFIVLGLRA